MCKCLELCGRIWKLAVRIFITKWLFFLKSCLLCIERIMMLRYFRIGAIRIYFRWPIKSFLIRILKGWMRKILRIGWVKEIMRKGIIVLPCKFLIKSKGWLACLTAQFAIEMKFMIVHYPIPLNLFLAFMRSFHCFDLVLTLIKILL